LYSPHRRRFKTRVALRYTEPWSSRAICARFRLGTGIWLGHDGDHRYAGDRTRSLPSQKWNKLTSFVGSKRGQKLLVRWDFRKFVRSCNAHFVHSDISFSRFCGFHEAFYDLSTSNFLVHIDALQNMPLTRHKIKLQQKQQETFKRILLPIVRIGSEYMPTHGSLSKAGKVRGQTPKVTPIEKTKPSPRLHARRNYEKRLILQRKSGQNWR
jgi:small subunit ribosomal protein S30e